MQAYPQNEVPERTLMSKIRELSRIVGISQRDLSQSMGLKPSQLNLYFNERAEMKAQRLVQILEILGIDIDELLTQRIRALGGDPTGSDIDDSSLYAKLGRVRGAKRRSLLKIIRMLGD